MRGLVICADDVTVENSRNHTSPPGVEIMNRVLGSLSSKESVKEVLFIGPDLSWSHQVNTCRSTFSNALRRCAIRDIGIVLFEGCELYGDGQRTLRMSTLRRLLRSLVRPGIVVFYPFHTRRVRMSTGDAEPLTTHMSRLHYRLHSTIDLGPNPVELESGIFWEGRAGVFLPRISYRIHKIVEKMKHRGRVGVKGRARWNERALELREP